MLHLNSACTPPDLPVDCKFLLFPLGLLTQLPLPRQLLHPPHFSRTLTFFSLTPDVFFSRLFPLLSFLVLLLFFCLWSGLFCLPHFSMSFSVLPECFSVFLFLCFSVFFFCSYLVVSSPLFPFLHSLTFSVLLPECFSPAFPFTSLALFSSVLPGVFSVLFLRFRFLLPFCSADPSCLPPFCFRSLPVPLTELSLLT